MNRTSSINFFTIAIFSICALGANASDTLKYVSNQFTNTVKYDVKKAGYAAKNAEQKLYITQKSNDISRFGLGLFSYSDFTLYYNVDYRFELKFLETNAESAFGTSFQTFDNTDNNGYHTTTMFMLTGDGQMRYYSGPVIEMQEYMLQPLEPCTAFKIGEVNSVALIRNASDWYLIVNGDTVKHTVEAQLEPIIRMASGDFLFAGKSTVEVDNFSFLSLVEKGKAKILAEKYQKISGSYNAYSDCLSGNRQSIKIQLAQIEKSNKFMLSGFGTQSIALYLDEKNKNVFDSYGTHELLIDDRVFTLSDFKLTKDEDDTYYKMTFELLYRSYEGNQTCEVEAEKQRH